MPALIARLLPLLAAIALLYGSWKLWESIHEKTTLITKSQIIFLVIVMVAAAIVIFSKIFGL